MKKHPSTVARTLSTWGLTQQTDAVLRAFAEFVVAELREGRRVTVPGLGVFRPRVRASSTRHLNGKTYDIPAKLLLTFKAFASVRELTTNRRKAAP